jgi:diketogulonate reductase-like aldo/keto reductase
VVKRIAKDKGVTESQVLLAWAARYTGGGAVTWDIFILLPVYWLCRTSRNPDRQKTQLESVEVMPRLAEKEIEEIAEAGRGLFKRFGQHEVWDLARS